MFGWLPWNRAKHQRLLAKPLSSEWWAVLETNVPITSRLDENGRSRLSGLIQVFLDDKSFEGLGGLAMTDEVRVTIAGQACLLLLGLEVEVPFPDLDVIRVYPSTYRAETRTYDGLIASQAPSHRLGESSNRGYVVLTWRASRAGGVNPHDGQNVVFHEFAHQLDTEDGSANGAPILHHPSDYGPWTRALSAAFTDLRHDAEQGRRNVLDAYGATDPAEFFAVATETFFEQPEALKHSYPDLYAVLSDYYRQDPAHGIGPLFGPA